MDKSEVSSLAGKRVVITRAPRQSIELLEKLAALGALPESLPLVAFAAPEDYRPMDAALDQLENFDWIIFTSVARWANPPIFPYRLASSTKSRCVNACASRVPRRNP